MSASRSEAALAAPGAGAPGRVALLVACGLALTQLAWAVFQWQQLVELRQGGEIFCGLASGGDCASLWDSAFAHAVRRFTLIPVAGWGVVWGLAALALPAAVLVRRGRGEPAGAIWSATVLVALAGALGVVLLIAASAREGTFCPNCVLTYGLVGGYTFVCVRAALASGPLALGPGAVGAVASLLVGYGIALYPATQTPARSEPPSMVTAAPEDSGESPSPDARLAQIIEGLSASERQALADALAAFRNAPQVPVRPARGLIGSPTAPVQVTEFADLLCVHCADLHRQLALLLRALPQGTFSIEPRYFPLDGRCNPLLQPAEGPPTRCVAAEVMICAAQHPDAFQLSGELFARRTSLSPDDVYAIASRYIPRSELEACVTSPETAGALQEDIEWAAEHEIRGTPLVLVNGRALPPSGPLLYTLILAGGDLDHPAFATLPPAASGSAGG